MMQAKFYDENAYVNQKLAGQTKTYIEDHMTRTDINYLVLVECHEIADQNFVGYSGDRIFLVWKQTEICTS